MEGTKVVHRNQDYIIMHDYKNGMVEIRNRNYKFDIRLVSIHELLFSSGQQDGYGQTG
ncbi:hypothetical protein ACVBAX_18960 [Robertmurraya sp. GLU-23]